MRVVGCFLEHEDKFLILKRHPDKPEGGTWGLPGGKVKEHESDSDAIVRELAEETGKVALTSELERIDEYDFVSGHGEPYTYVTYRTRVEKRPDIIMEDDAHIDNRWVTPEECYAMPGLIKDFDTLLRLTGYVSVQPVT
jgi:8-oxo-dGTP pyrophosphatase MutT (NUDIX family)